MIDIGSIWLKLLFYIFVRFQAIFRLSFLLNDPANIAAGTGSTRTGSTGTGRTGSSTSTSRSSGAFGTGKLVIAKDHASVLGKLLKEHPTGGAIDSSVA